MFNFDSFIVLIRELFSVKVLRKVILYLCVTGVFYYGFNFFYDIFTNERNIKNTTEYVRLRDVELKQKLDTNNKTLQHGEQQFYDNLKQQKEFATYELLLREKIQSAGINISEQYNNDLRERELLKIQSDIMKIQIEQQQNQERINQNQQSINQEQEKINLEKDKYNHQKELANNIVNAINQAQKRTEGQKPSEDYTKPSLTEEEKENMRNQLNKPGIEIKQQEQQNPNYDIYYDIYGNISNYPTLQFMYKTLEDINKERDRLGLEPLEEVKK